MHAFDILTATEQMVNPPQVPTPKPPSIPSVMPERLQRVVDRLEEQLPEQAMPIKLIEEYEDVDGKVIPAHMKGLYRFSEKDTKEKCLDDIEEKLVDLKWYKIQYHQCNHSAEGENRPCGKWQVEVEKGTVPEAFK